MESEMQYTKEYSKKPQIHQNQKHLKKKTQGELKRKSLRQGRIIKVKSGEIKCDGYLEKWNDEQMNCPRSILKVQRGVAKNP